MTLKNNHMNIANMISSLKGGCNWNRRGILLLFAVIIRMLHFTVGDNLALLSGTLRTYQKAACDEEVMTLKCPRGTSISIQFAQYGKSTPSQNLCATELAQYTPTIVEIVGNSSCLWPNALQTVVEACQKKRQCKFHTSPKAFGGDPCPGVRKYVEVAYKCRPYEFRSKVGCENDVLQMTCNPHSRIAIYSASFGRTEYESIQCPQPQGVPEETCLVSYATETVMQMCHGKRRCSLSADSSTFGNPCRPESRMYLKVVYTCVPRKVLKERYEDAPEDDEVPLHEGHLTSESDDYDTDPGEDNWYKESAAIPPAPKVAAGPANQTENTSGPGPALMGPSGMGPEPDGGRQVTRRPHGASDTRGDNDFTQSFYLYLIISIAGSLLLCLCIGIAHCAVKRHYSKRDAKAPDISATTDLPNGFGDNISEVDRDIDMTNDLPIAAVNSSLKPDRVTAFSDVTLGPKYSGRALNSAVFVGGTANMYGPSDEYVVAMGTLPRIVEGGTLRRGPPPQMGQQPTDVVVSPRSLNRCSNAQYYYG